MTAPALGGLLIARIGAAGYVITALLGVCLIAYGIVLWVDRRTTTRIADMLRR